MDIDEFIKTIKFDENGLVPAIAQDYLTNDVLMLAYMDEEALKKTLSTGRVHYYSRSRKSLWLKGETSGHFQRLKSLRYDCDNDAILVRIDQTGAACHTGHRSCFFSEFTGNAVIDVEKQHRNGSKAGHPLPDNAGIIDAVYSVILQRKNNPPPKSYVHSLMAKGVAAINAKITEEASELAEAGKEKKDADVVYEAADLIFHLLVLLGFRDIAITDVYQELARRFGVSGIEEKESRKK
ncbi:MAG: bifunctional phosphoribosyl-AMP cyclohydrolase/phosphoribosyl-ATP diphosphatase HisIE [Deltaproteobacteria bacterium]|nr:bifunctional phosphoribosyl-AMP cyclohydrolase/phosphoribosyl-ATP diphosphatase HisIE [Deltaproteobacteria bacterium]